MEAFPERITCELSTKRNINYKVKRGEGVLETESLIISGIEIKPLWLD